VSWTKRKRKTLPKRKGRRTKSGTRGEKTAEMSGLRYSNAINIKAL
jgi:hypothetical protein